jgi:hypothetical protein
MQKRTTFSPQFWYGYISEELLSQFNRKEPNLVGTFNGCSFNKYMVFVVDRKEFNATFNNTNDFLIEK